MDFLKSAANLPYALCFLLRLPTGQIQLSQLLPAAARCRIWAAIWVIGRQRFLCLFLIFLDLHIENAKCHRSLTESATESFIIIIISRTDYKVYCGGIRTLYSTQGDPKQTIIGVLHALCLASLLLGRGTSCLKCEILNCL
jgi:hypothetical protein